MSKISNDKGLIENVNRDKVEKLISELVKIPSPWFKEEEITKYVKKWLEKKRFRTMVS
jgi:acetylornithine deacetylase/succinyl-diaminopimelate desuccinylase-like protein